MSGNRVEQLLNQPDAEQQTRWLDAHLAQIDDAFVETLKNTAVQLRMSDPDRALAIAQLMAAIAARTGVARQRGYGLWAAAVVTSLGKGDYTAALALYDEAIAIFTAAGDVVSPAVMQVSRLWSLANLNRTDEALTVGASAAQVLRENGRWLPLATLQMNVASVYTRLGEYGKALAMYEEQQRSYESFGLASAEIEGLWALAVHNRAIALCYLGRFAESIAASQVALAVQERLGNKQEAARVRQHLAVTYVILGRYNEALRLFDQVRAVFAADQLERHAARVDLYMCECWLHLRRFDRVIAKTPAIRRAFAAAGAPHEQGIAALYAAMAYAGDRNAEAALPPLAAARAIFAGEGSAVWIAHCDLQMAQLRFGLGDDAACVAAAHAAAAEFGEEGQRVKEAEALLVAARALARQGQRAAAQAQIERVAAIGAREWAPELLFQMHAVQGELARADGNLARAYTELQQAIAAVEQLRSHLMVDLRVSFQEDKVTLYEDMVEVCLARGDATQGLQYADRAKSRTLVELLDGRVQARMRTRHAADRPLVDELVALRTQRDQLCRHRQNREPGVERGLAVDFEPGEKAQLAHLEQRIAELWDALLIRNADYAEDADLHLVAPRPLTLALDADTLLVEYFAVRGRLLVFVVRAGVVQAIPLDSDLSQVRRLVERLHQHMRTVPHFPPDRLPDLVRQAQFLLGQLYTELLAPLRDTLAGYTRLVIVPHGVLHYVPFHALFDGSEYVAAHWAVTYLPNAALLGATQTRPAAQDGLLALGYSAGDTLPHAVAEAIAVANLGGGDLLLEADATRARLAAMVTGRRIVHLATHGEFHSDQPLFSGLLLADGWLATLDVFDLEMSAALVTLSACESGRSVLGGGDELLGLVRAFLHAGANALLISMWSVEDRCTRRWMQSFYTHLLDGCSKADAIRRVQQEFLRAAAAPRAAGEPAYDHPYFWAPFFLIGDTAPLDRAR